MEKQHSETKPSPYLITTEVGRPVLTVNFDIEEKEGQWEYNSVKLLQDEIDYGSIVSAIIDFRYSNDQMQAIVNNYLLGDHTHDAEFNEMQEYRKYAKNTAKEIIEKIIPKTEE